VSAVPSARKFALAAGAVAMGPLVLPGALGAVAPPEDRQFPGVIHLAVDASDIDRHIVQVHETLTGVTPDTVLLYPQWLPGVHAPTGPIDRLAGLSITANGAPVPWTRDPVDVFAFHVQVPADAQSIDLTFQYLSPTSPRVGRLEMNQSLMIFDWNAAVLYPAGYYSQQIAVQPELTLPPGWRSATALEQIGGAGAHLQYKPVNLDMLIDSPVYAGLYLAQFDLDPGASAPVRLDIFADKPVFMGVRPDELAAYRALVQQTYRLFGSHHFAHYDFLYSLSDDVMQKGLEHHQSTEVGASPNVFLDWSRTGIEHDLLAHEFVHSWNGKFRRPADLWTANYNVPMQGSLLWVYEGQTQYWGQVLAGRAGLRTRQQALDQLAMTAAGCALQTGRRWRPLSDTTMDEILNPRHPMSWRDYQRFEDYYNDGLLIWLDADTLIRQRSHGKHSLDDFARGFFGIDDGSIEPVTYTFDDVVAALKAVEPYDWATFLRERVDATDKPAPLDGISRGGYRLVFTDTPSDYNRAADDQRRRHNQTFSIGLDIDAREGTIVTVVWDSPAFHANLIEGETILAVNGNPYSGEALTDAIRAAKGSSSPIELIVRGEQRYRVVDLDYHDGLRYPHLERDKPKQPALLDDIFNPRPAPSK
jgi:predicted metalloprotease with PDZ domain